VGLRDDGDDDDDDDVVVACAGGAAGVAGSEADKDTGKEQQNQ
jgi:hypothetical protein